LIPGFKVTSLSKAHQPSHHNLRTGKELRNIEQVCPVCFENFANNGVGDIHRVGEIGTPERRCAEPTSVGLQLEENKFGTLVWNKIK
jgi:hypothetical protein